MRVWVSASLLGGECHFSAPRVAHGEVFWPGTPNNFFVPLPVTNDTPPGSAAMARSQATEDQFGLLARTQMPKAPQGSQEASASSRLQLLTPRKTRIRLEEGKQSLRPVLRHVTTRLCFFVGFTNACAIPSTPKRIAESVESRLAVRIAISTAFCIVWTAYPGEMRPICVAIGPARARVALRRPVAGGLTIASPFRPVPCRRGVRESIGSDGAFHCRSISEDSAALRSHQH